MRRLKPLELFTINAYWPGLSFMWNSLHLIVLPAMLLGVRRRRPQEHRPRAC